MEGYEDDTFEKDDEKYDEKVDEKDVNRKIAECAHRKKQAASDAQLLMYL